ncbi:MAG: Na/Pi cotransporter family protein [Campylobacterales bacterium]|nr:Na/Pi cotransporter family protein [Campylobacterales bacterium]
MKRSIVFFVMIALGYAFTQSADFLTISAGVAIFLFGMLSLENGFKAFSGGLLETVLKRSTDKLSKSLGFGIITTTLMQSSSLVSVLTISFLSAGLITLSAGIGIIFGANLGTTTGAWLVAGFGLKVDIGVYAMPMLVFGMMLIFRKDKPLQGLGYVLAGLGFLFLGIHYMKEGFEAFKETLDLSQYAMTGFKGVFFYTAIGILATLVMQSSHATLVLTITALAAGQIGYENALALAIGSNVGTTVTAIIGSLGANIEGRKLAIAHLIFNFTTGIVAIAFIYQLVDVVEILSTWAGIKAEDFTLKLALFHTLFNVLGIVLMLPFTRTLVWFLDTYITTQAKTLVRTDDVLYLNEATLEFPDAAKEVLFKETKHLYVNGQSLIAYALSVRPGDITSGIAPEEIITQRSRPMPKDMEDLYERKFKPIYSKIIDFAVRAQTNANEADTEAIMEIRRASLRLAEAIKDAKHLQTNMLRYLASSNAYIAEEYNFIRASLIKQLRHINVLLNTEEEEMLTLFFGKIELESKAFDAVSGRSLDKLIREQKITNTMATSLMNDTAYASAIANNLTSMAKILFTNYALYKHTHEVITQSDDTLTPKRSTP